MVGLGSVGFESGWGGGGFRSDRLLGWLVG